jgi:hypothetical protein
MSSARGTENNNLKGPLTNPYRSYPALSGLMNVAMSELGVHGSASRRARSSSLKCGSAGG